MESDRGSPQATRWAIMITSFTRVEKVRELIDLSLQVMNEVIRGD